MKTPTDNTSLGAGATIALINGGKDVQMVDLWTITLSGGQVIRWCGGPAPITFNGHTWTLGPLIDRGKIVTKLAAEVATLDMQITANSSDLINGTPIIPYLRTNGLDGASIKLETGYLASWALPLVVTGTLIDFSGRVTSVKKVSRTTATVTVSSWLILLNTKADPNLFQAPCQNTLYDTNCTLAQSSYQHSGTVAAGGSTTQFNTNLTLADDTCTQGYIKFLTGVNAGLQRAVSKQLLASGSVSMAYPLPNAPASGDTFYIYDGCNLTMSRCSGHFNNLLHFRGMPFIPAPETILN